MMNDSGSKHRLFNLLMSTPEVTESEIEELFSDLKFVFENSFDTLIEEAVSSRKCTYIEFAEQKAC
jgi:hypothetical protein